MLETDRNLINVDEPQAQVSILSASAREQHLNLQSQQAGSIRLDEQSNDLSARSGNLRVSGRKEDKSLNSLNEEEELSKSISRSISKLKHDGVGSCYNQKRVEAVYE